MAEVLITLTIIGVIAALTIPNLSRKWSDHADVQKVKQAYSILSNAYRLCIAENGTMENWDWGVALPAWAGNNYKNKLFECMRPYLKVQKYCGSGSGCWNSNVKSYKDLSGKYNTNIYSSLWGMSTISSAYGKMKLQNGMYISDGTRPLYVDKNGNAYDGDNGAIRVDINGEKGPNRYGYDVFFFNISRDGIIPIRRPSNSNSVRAARCITTDVSWLSGVTCAEWVIKHGNMDYKYRNVSAEW